MELTSRTGKNPQYSYIQLGCSKRAELRMLSYARTLVGKPFSNSGMARSILYPRQTDGSSFFCAELVASVLKAGGLLSQTSNPGAATPQSLHRMYRKQAAVTANPYVLRGLSGVRAAPTSETARLIGFGNMLERSDASSKSRSFTQRRRDQSPPRATFHCIGGKAGGRV